MNKTAIYHVCLSSHEEVMFRSAEDLRMGFNCLAAAALATESRLLADGFMTTHFHALVQTASVQQFMYRARNAYSRYFNTKYSRSGRLGEKRYFSLEIEGHYHTLAALNYVIRQGLHHGLANTPFEYPFCSATAYFRQELGRTAIPPLLNDRSRHRYLPSNVIIPLKYRMSADGQLLREDVLDVTWVEQNYITPQNFSYHMNRIANERDIQEQKEENQLPPVTLEAIEKGVPGFVLKEAQIFEKEHGVRNAMTDLEFCSYLDKQLLPRIVKGTPDPTIFMLSDSRRAELGTWIWRKYNEVKFKNISGKVFSSKTITEPQLRRCLALK